MILWIGLSILLLLLYIYLDAVIIIITRKRKIRIVRIIYKGRIYKNSPDRLEEYRFYTGENTKGYKGYIRRYNRR